MMAKLTESTSYHVWPTTQRGRRLEVGKRYMIIEFDEKFGEWIENGPAELKKISFSNEIEIETDLGSWVIDGNENSLIIRYIFGQK